MVLFKNVYLRLAFFRHSLAHFGVPVCFCSEETVEVGANLYELDTDIAATVNTHFSAGLTEEPKSAPATPPPSAPKPDPVLSANDDEEDIEHHRTPAIRFLGKEGWTHRLAGHEEDHHHHEEEMAPVHASSATVPSTAAKSKSPSAPTEVIVMDMPPMYGRPRFTDAEMDALISGGADAAPKVVKQSGGAKFSYM